MSAWKFSAHKPWRCAPSWMRPLVAVSLLVLLVFVLLCWQAPAAEAQQVEQAQQAEQEPDLPDEYTMKAVFLYGFGRYVTWPDTAFAGKSAPFVIGILGEDSFGGALDKIAAKRTIQGRKIVVRRFASIDDYKQPCNILFVSRSLTSEQQAAVIEKTEGKSVLVVGETPGFAEHGAIANFFVDGDRVRFELNVNNARRAQLRMDAKLLSLGKPVGTQQSAASNNALPIASVTRTSE